MYSASLRRTFWLGPIIRTLTMLILLPLLLLTLAQAGHYLIWLPTLSKSVKIGVVEVGLALGSGTFI